MLYVYAASNSCKVIPFLGEESDSTEQNQGFLPSILTEEVVDNSHEAAMDDAYQADDGGTSLKYGSQRKMVDGE